MSGIYIPNMEMPKACIFCELYDHENYWCNAARKDVEPCFGEKLCSFCPLISVPDHGDLIDRDASLYALGRIVIPDDLAYTIGHDMAKRFFEKATVIIPEDKEY